MMPIDIAKYLDSLGIGVYDELSGSTNPNNNIFIGIMPQEPQDIILINQYAGEQPLHKVLDDIQRPGLQIKCRAKYYDYAIAKAEEINLALDQYSGEINGKYYVEIRAVQSPFLLEQDKNECVVFCQNFMTAIRQLAKM